MTLRNKTLIIITVTLAGLIGLLYFISQTILLSSFAELEDQGVRQNVERVSAALQDELTNLDSTAGDWAHWDETYAFVQDRNEEYIENNLMDSTLTNLNLNFMLFFDTSNRLVFGKAVDLQSGSAVDVPQNLQDYLISNKQILHHANLEDRLTGIIPLPEAPFLFASWPILTNNSEGPVHGALVLGRYLNAAEIESLAEATRLSFSIRSFDEPQLPLDYQAARAALTKDSSIFVRPLDQGRIAGYTLLKDVYDQPAVLLKVDMPRDIYRQGRASLSYFILSFLISGLVFGLVIMLLLEKGVLSRLTQLSQSVNSIGASGDSSERVVITGSDELAGLGRNINKMLAALGQSEEALRKAHQQLETRVEERTAELSKSNEMLVREIQERQQAEAALRQSEQRFRQFVSSISDHIYVTEITSDGRHVNHYLSHHVESLTGYLQEKFVNDWSFWPTTVIHPDDRLEAAVQATRLARGQNSQLEYRLTRADGKVIWVRDSAQAEKDPERQSTWVYGVISDITERKRAEEELAKAHQAALEASRLKSQLLANVSHDLRTPLNAILGYVDMLQEGIYGPVSDKQRSITQKIINSTTHLTSMVNKLLDQAQLEAGTLKLTKTSFAPHSLIDYAQATMGVLAEHKDLQLISDVAADMPVNLSGDLLRLQQIIANLVGNAIKFTEHGVVHLHLYRPDETHWVIQVADTGPGIPVEAQAHIFDVFWQVDGTATRRYTGFGLGLSIVKQLATIMGGQVQVESKLGQGSTFTVLLPLTPEREVVT
jgi:PAS domain S-box-containing protein